MIVYVQLLNYQILLIKPFWSGIYDILKLLLLSQAVDYDIKLRLFSLLCHNTTCNWLTYWWRNSDRLSQKLQSTTPFLLRNPSMWQDSLIKHAMYRKYYISGNHSINHIQYYFPQIYVFLNRLLLILNSMAYCHLQSRRSSTC